MRDADPQLAIRAWLALPELAIPDSGWVEVTVLAASVLVPTSQQLGAAGIRSYLPLGDGAHGVLATITADGPTSKRRLRLPPVVAGWAAECCSDAQQGGSPFPATVRFRRCRDGVEVAVSHSSYRARIPSKVLSVYVDESGNTGDAALVSSVLGTQPSFAIVGLGDADDAGTLDQILAELRRKYRIGADEIKGRIMDKHPRLILDLVQYLKDLGVPLFVELMDKPFFVASNIVSFALAGAWLPMSEPDGRRAANALAELIAEELGLPAICAYCEFAREPTPASFETFKATFRRQVVLASERANGTVMEEPFAWLAELFEEEVVGCATTSQGAEPEYLRLIPPADQRGNGKRIAMLPHIPALTHLCARVNRFAPDSVGVQVVHDEQLQVGDLLAQYLQVLTENRHAAQLNELQPASIANWTFAPGRFSLEFRNSRESRGVQVADLLGRFFTRQLNASINGTPAGDDPALGVLFEMQDEDLGIGVNLVTTSARYRSFWGSATAEEKRSLIR